MNVAASLAALALALAPVSTGTRPAADVPASVPEKALPPVEERLDAALGDDRALLSFLPEDVRSGRYTMPVREFRVDKPAQNRSGVFWRTASGNAYTRVEPYDEELVRREVGALVDHFARRREELRAKARAAGRDPESYRAGAAWDWEKVSPLWEGVPFYGGSEYQWPLWKVFVPALMPDLSNKVHMDDEGCSLAVDAVTEAIRTEVNALRPAFRPAGTRDRWTVDVAALRAATAGEADAARRAGGGATEGGSYDVDGALSVVVERWRTGVAYWIDTDRRDHEGEGVVHVTPADVGPPPARPDPAPEGRDGMHDFLMAVAACRALPWEYTDFMADTSYARPYSEEYAGPSSLMRPAWVCDRDVPPRHRNGDG
jgi:hypothetical protein